jgi:membrane protease YdiL (CAAX protease family)
MSLLAALVVIGLVLFWWVYVRGGDRKNRIQGAKRIAYGIPFLAFMFVAGFIFGAYVVLVWIIDSIWQILTGREGLDPNGKATRLHEWRDHNLRFLLGQNSAFRVIP